MNKNKMQDKLLKMVIVLFPVAVVLVVMQLSALALTNVIYQAGHNEVSFLTYSVSHTQKKLTTQPLHIEYSVLKVPAGKTTGASK